MRTFICFITFFWVDRGGLPRLHLVFAHVHVDPSHVLRLGSLGRAIASSVADSCSRHSMTEIILLYALVESVIMCSTPSRLTRNLMSILRSNVSYIYIYTLRPHVFQVFNRSRCFALMYTPLSYIRRHQVSHVPQCLPRSNLSNVYPNKAYVDTTWITKTWPNSRRKNRAILNKRSFQHFFWKNRALASDIIWCPSWYNPWNEDHGHRCTLIKVNLPPKRNPQFWWRRCPICHELMDYQVEIHQTLRFGQASPTTQRVPLFSMEG